MLIKIIEAAQEWVRVRERYSAYQILRVPPVVVLFMIDHGMLTPEEIKVLYDVAHRREIAAQC